MSILATVTEKSALHKLVRCLKYFDALADKRMTAADNFAACDAERHIRGIIETNGFNIEYKAGNYLLKKASDDSYSPF